MHRSLGSINLIILRILAIAGVFALILFTFLISVKALGCWGYGAKCSSQCVYGAYEEKRESNYTYECDAGALPAQIYCVVIGSSCAADGSGSCYYSNETKEVLECLTWDSWGCLSCGELLSCNTAFSCVWYANGESNPPLVSATNSSATWVKNEITAVVSASDADSGLAGVRYNWGSNAMNAGCTTGGLATYNGDWLVAPAGGTTLYLCALDNFGNVATWSGIYNYDNSLPSLSASNASTTWYGSARSATVSVSDTFSGLVETRYSFWSSNMNASCSSGGTTTVNGVSLNAPANGTTLYMCARDLAGNVRNWNGVYNWETTPPSLSASNASSSWFKAQRTAELFSNDGNSGLVEIRYSWNSNPMNASCTSGGANDKISGDSINAPIGGATLYLCSRDGAGNVATWSGTYNWETTAPVCGTWSPGTSPWHGSGGQEFTLSGSTDSGGSGIVSASGGCTTTAVNGATCTYTLWDNATNSTVCTSPTNNLDMISAPTTIYVNNGSAQTGREVPAISLINFDLRFSAVNNDSLSGHEANYYQAQVATDPGFSDIVWDSGKLAMTNCPAGNRCADISYSGTSVSAGETRYVRIMYWDTTGVTSPWSSGGEFRMNIFPVVSNVQVNGGVDITLLAGSEKPVDVTATLTDADGFDDVTTYSAALYRSGVNRGYACFQNDYNCYQLPSSSCVLSACTETSCDMTCTVNMKYYADATDAGIYASESWKLYVILVDKQTSASQVYTADGFPEVNSLLAMSVDSTPINYGPVQAGSNTGNTNVTTKITNNGNVNLDLSLNASNLCSDYPTCDVLNTPIDASAHRFATTAFDYSLGGTALSLIPQNQDLNLNPTAETDLYWGFGVPSGIKPQSYTGQIYIDAILH